MRLLLNIVNYQAIWFLCVIGGNGLAWLGLLLIAGHLLVSNQRRSDLILMISLAVGGAIIDGSLKQLGLFSFPEDNSPIPFWLMVIWMALATLPNHSLAWLQNRLFIAALLGSIGGPLAYWGGTRLNAATFHWSLTLSLLTLTLVWSITTPAIMKLSNFIRETAR